MVGTEGRHLAGDVLLGGEWPEYNILAGIYLNLDSGAS